MSKKGDALSKRLKRALGELSDQYLSHPQVELIDIGYPPGNREKEVEVVLRIHLKDASARETLNLPSEIEGIPVHVIEADYRLE